MTWSEPSRRWDRDGLVEYRCEHGVGHPAYGSALWIAEAHGWDVDTELIHGCCGCCSREDFPGTPERSLVRAHELLRTAIGRIEELEERLNDSL